MDIGLAKTFLSISQSGSFQAAATQLNITQTAVSARIRSLEQQLGCRLFIRNKSGARLTPAGERFTKHATILVQALDRARQHVRLAEGRASIASVGAELGLWNPHLAHWLAWMHHHAPDVALRTVVDMQANLIEAVQAGSLDMAIVYDPPRVAGLAVELLEEEHLVLVSTDATRTELSPTGYVHVDWGRAFDTSFRAAFPHINTHGIYVSHGPLALQHILAVGGLGYFRHNAVDAHIKNQTLFLVPMAPTFSYSAHLIHSAHSDKEMVDKIRSALLSRSRLSSNPSP